MKKYIIFLTTLGLLSLSSCDKVKNPFPPKVKVDLDTSIYAGSWSDYVANKWPDFSLLPNEDPERNVLIEDFTGHNCAYCPAAGLIAHNLHLSNPARIFVASIHASNTTTGMSLFQALNIPQGYTVDFTNPEGLELGSFFGTQLVNSGFFGNPAGTINRTNVAGEYFQSTGTWQTKVNQILSSAPKIALKAKVNYFETPKHGFFLHTEVEKLDKTITDDLAMVVYMIEDSLVAQQNVSNVPVTNYVHRDLFRGTIDGQIWGRTLTPTLLQNGKYYLNYSCILPNQLGPQGIVTTYNADNMHVLIYVYNKTTLEIYQVIEKRIIP